MAMHDVMVKIFCTREISVTPFIFLRVRISNAFDDGHGGM